VYNIFLTSQDKQYIPDHDHAFLTKPITFNKHLVLEEHPVQILGRRMKQLCINQIPFIQVHWPNYTSSEATSGNWGRSKSQV